MTDSVIDSRARLPGAARHLRRRRERARARAPTDRRRGISTASSRSASTTGSRRGDLPARRRGRMRPVHGAGRVRGITHVNAAADAGAVVLAVSAGLQLIGTTLPGADGRPVSGLGLVDAVTTRTPKRLVGEVAVRDEVLGTGWLVGFENHRGVTAIASGAAPIGPREPERGCETDGVVPGTWSAPICTAPYSRATRSSRISSSIGSRARSRRWRIPKPTCCTRSGTPRSWVHAGGRAGHGDRRYARFRRGGRVAGVRTTESAKPDYEHDRVGVRDVRVGDLCRRGL